MKTQTKTKTAATKTAPKTKTGKGATKTETTGRTYLTIWTAIMAMQYGPEVFAFYLTGLKNMFTSKSATALTRDTAAILTVDQTHDMFTRAQAAKRMDPNGKAWQRAYFGKVAQTHGETKMRAYWDAARGLNSQTTGK